MPGLVLQPVEGIFRDQHAIMKCDFFGIPYGKSTASVAGDIFVYMSYHYGLTHHIH